MTDAPLLGALAAADTAPPPGAPFGVEQLAARATVQGRRQFSLAIALLFAAAPLVWCAWPRAHRAGPVDAAADLDAELRGLAARLERLHDELAQPHRAPAPVDATPDERLSIRAALAEARVSALSSFHAPETHR